MRSRLLNSILVLLLAATSFTANIATAEEPEPQIDKIIDFLAFGTGSTTGTYFPLGNAFGNIWTQKSKTVLRAMLLRKPSLYSKQLII